MRYCHQTRWSWAREAQLELNDIRLTCPGIHKAAELVQIQYSTRSKFSTREKIKFYAMALQPLELNHIALKLLVTLHTNYYAYIHQISESSLKPNI